MFIKNIMKKFLAISSIFLLLTSCSMKKESLKIEDIKVGGGAEATVGDTVEMHYVGTLEDGTKFDSSRDRGQTFSFTIGEGEVIEGWEKGIPGMQVGGLRKLTIPPDMGYGRSGAGGVIPPNATLIFEVELISIE